MKKQNSKKVPATEKTPVTQPTQEELDRRKGFITAPIRDQLMLTKQEKKGLVRLWRWQQKSAKTRIVIGGKPIQPTKWGSALLAA